MSTTSESAAAVAVGVTQHDTVSEVPAWRRPGVALGAATLGVLVLARFGGSLRGVVAAAVTVVLVVLSAVDLDERRIPNRIVLPAAGLVLAAQVAFWPGHTLEWLAASLGTAVFLFLPTLVNSAGIGMGDVKLGLLMGAALGKLVMPALVLGFVATWPVVVYLFFKHGKAARKMTLPLGPFLSFGAILVLLLSDGLPGA